MSGLPPGALWAVRLGLLVQSLLLIGPSCVSAGARPHLDRSTQNRIPPTNARIASTPEQPDRCVHVVRRGESMARLAALYRTTRRSIIAANLSITPVRRLRVGQRLHIPACQPAPVRPHEGPETASVNSTVTGLLARVGPSRVLTRLFLSVPDFAREAVRFQWPVEGPVASGFGRRHMGWHAGIDIQAEMGTPIRAAASGTVIENRWERSYGRLIKIQHPDGFTSLYAHNLENLVEVGDEVEAGAVIGTVGRTGHASANHLHFEIRHEGAAYNPLPLLETRDTRIMATAPAADVAAAISDGNDDRE